MGGPPGRLTLGYFLSVLSFIRIRIFKMIVKSSTSGLVCKKRGSNKSNFKPRGEIHRNDIYRKRTTVSMNGSTGIEGTDTLNVGPSD